LDRLIFRENLSKTKVCFYFCLIISGGFIFRYIFFPFDIPLVLDSLGYFWYGIDLSVAKDFPTTYSLANNLWPTFLSFFFSLTNSENYLDFMFIQRNISILFSVMTAIPVYFLAKRFVKKDIALIAPLFFIFEPRIIINSFSGVTEPMFIFFVVSTLALFFSNEKKLILFSFVLAGIFCLVRYEGLMIVISMFIIMFWRFIREKKGLVYPFGAIGIFLIVITPMMLIQTDTLGYDGLFSHVGAGANVVIRDSFFSAGPETVQFFPEIGLSNFLKLLGWILIPSYIIFLPIGIFYFFKNKENKKIELIIIGLCAIIPALYAYSRGISDTRYLLVIYPILIIFALNCIDWLTRKWPRQYNFKIIIIVFLITTSFIFLSFKDENEHNREAFEIAEEVTSRTNVINHSYHMNTDCLMCGQFEVPEAKYYRSANIANLQTFPVLRAEMQDRIEFVELVEHDSLESYIEFGRKQGLTYLVIDHSDNQPPFLQDVFIHEEKYPYLLKEFDSKDFGYQYHVKIFRIDYEVLK